MSELLTLISVLSIGEKDKLWLSYKIGYGDRGL